MQKKHELTKSKSTANTKTQMILCPKKFGCKEKTKLVALIVHSPYDESGAAVSYSSTADTLRDTAGYGVINKQKITWDKDPDKLIKPVQMKGKPLTIWVEAHGAPGWFFAGERSARDEYLCTIQFAAYVKQIETITGGKVDNIVLSGCFTANELINVEACTYFCSPARMLSILLPGINVMGFVGQNATAVVTNVYEKKGTDYIPITVKPEEAAVLFNSGKVIEEYSRQLYCNHKYTPIFIRKKCKLNLEEVNRDEVFYEPCRAVEKIANTPQLKAIMTGESYGEKQVKFAEKELERQLAAAAKEQEEPENTTEAKL